MAANHSEYYLKPEQIKKLIYACDRFRDRCIIKLLAYTGLRREEIRQLDVRDVDFDARRIYVRSGKGGEGRTVIADQSVLADLKHLIGRKNKGPLFQSQKGGPISGPQVNRIVAAAGKAANLTNPNPDLKNINPHLLRHSFARNALKTGMRMELVQQQLGHKSIKTTIDVYGRPSIEDIQEAYDEKLEGIYG